MPRRPKRKRLRHDTPSANGAYVLIVRGPNGRLRAERFADAESYRARLATLDNSEDVGVSAEEIAGLLDG